MKTKIAVLFLMVIGFSDFAMAQSVDEYEMEYATIVGFITSDNFEAIEDTLTKESISSNHFICSSDKKYETYFFIAAQRHNQLFGLKNFYENGQKMGKDFSTQNQKNEENINNNNKIGLFLIEHGDHPCFKGPSGSAHSIASTWEIFKTIICESDEHPTVGKDCR